MKQLFFILLSIYAFGFELKYNSFISDFNQSVRSENKTINYKGKVYVNHELIFWHYTKPIEKKIWVTLDNKIYVYEPDLEQVTIYNTSKKDNFFKLIRSAKKIKDNLYLKEYDNRKIYFETNNGLIKKIYYKDKIDNLVTLNFYNTQKKDINLSKFTPKYPSYVDIIYAK
jgi:outer membrane lipoprotein carrier protein